MLNALQNVAYDIEALAGGHCVYIFYVRIRQSQSLSFKYPVGLDELVEINTSAVDSLTNQVYLLQS